MDLIKIKNSYSFKENPKTGGRGGVGWNLIKYFYLEYIKNFQNWIRKQLNLKIGKRCEQTLIKKLYNGTQAQEKKLNVISYQNTNYNHHTLLMVAKIKTGNNNKWRN